MWQVREYALDLRDFHEGSRGNVIYPILVASDEDDTRLRWRFTGTGPDSFTWQGQASHDGGRTWVSEEQMRATRHRSR